MDQVPVTAMPKCPSCSAQPMPLIMHEVTTNAKGIVLGMTCCAMCGCVLSTFPLGMVEPKIMVVGGRN